VNDAVEDRVGKGGNADQIMPAVHGNLAGDDERAFVVAILDDFPACGPKPRDFAYLTYHVGPRTPIRCAPQQSCGMS